MPKPNCKQLCVVWTLNWSQAVPRLNPDQAAHHKQLCLTFSAQTLYIYLYISATVKKEKDYYTELGDFFRPPTVPSSHFLLLSQRKPAEGKQWKENNPRLVAAYPASFHCLVQNEMAHCKSSSKQIFALGAVLCRLPKIVQRVPETRTDTEAPQNVILFISCQVCVGDYEQKSEFNLFFF